MSGMYGGERLALMETEHDGQTNGHGSPPAPPRFRLVVRTRHIELDGDYAGLTATIRTNVPIGDLLGLMEVATGADEASTTRAFGEMVNRLPHFISAWNLDDERGDAVPLTPAGIRANVPADLLMALVGKMAETPPVPKG